jgi:hypothetical protein
MMMVWNKASILRVPSTLGLTAKSSLVGIFRGNFFRYITPVKAESDGLTNQRVHTRGSIAFWAPAHSHK